MNSKTKEVATNKESTVTKPLATQPEEEKSKITAESDPSVGAKGTTKTPQPVLVASAAYEKPSGNPGMSLRRTRSSANPTPEK